MNRFIYILIIPTIDALCHICGKAANNGIKYPNIYIQTEKATCANIAVKVAKATNKLKYNNPICQEYQERYNFCCNGLKPDGDPYTPPPVVIPTVQKTGPYPICNLCRNAAFPTDKHHVINMLYIGAGTCEQYYLQGLKGNVPTHLCDPLRYFANEPCGCSPNSSRNIQLQDNWAFTTATALALPSLLMFVLLLCYKLKTSCRRVTRPLNVMRSVESFRSNSSSH